MDREPLTFQAERVVPTSPSVAFRANTEPSELAQWWGPRGFACPSVEIDPRVGGGYRIAMQPPEGKLFHLSGEFVEVEPAARLAYTFRWEPPHPDDRETVVTVSFEDAGEETRVTVHQGVFATEDRRALHWEGWNETLDRLREHLAHGASGQTTDTG